MKFRSIDNDGNWNFGNGLQDYTLANNAIMLSIKTRLLSFFNDCFFSLTDGVNWFTVLAQKDRNVILNAVQVNIIGAYGVTKINSIDSYVENRKIFITYNIDTIYTKNQNAIMEVPA